MVIELNPGSSTAGTAPAGFTVPVDQTLPNVNFDEILSALDGDTRSYLQLLLGSAGEGLDGQGKTLSAGLKRFEPTAIYLAKINGALAVRERNIRRSIHNFRLLAQVPGNKDDDLALVDSSTRCFRCLPTRTPICASDCRNCPTPWTRPTTLAKVDKLGQVLGPTLGALRPGARAPGPAGSDAPVLVQTTPIIQNQLRPFARRCLWSRSCGRRKRPRGGHAEADHLGQVLNYLLNERPTTRRVMRRLSVLGGLGQPRRRHGLLSQDAQGPIRPAWSWPRARPCRCSTSSAGRAQPGTLGCC
jgi:phospholipid/cholesterol/gamma-HCH transport system substrate-binding protein